MFIQWSKIGEKKGEREKGIMVFYAAPGIGDELRVCFGKASRSWVHVIFLAQDSTITQLERFIHIYNSNLIKGIFFTNYLLSSLN